MEVNVIGAGLAGCEASWYLANKGHKVKLFEQRPLNSTPAHNTDKFAELVCSNSLRSYELATGPGLLKYEMAKLNSIVMKAAMDQPLAAGSALAVDRHHFSNYITDKIYNHPNIEVITQEYYNLDDTPTIICTGPLTSDKLLDSLKNLLGDDFGYFFDAAAPIIEFDSINMDKAYFKSRYDKGEASYINCPMTKEEFEYFYHELINAKCVEPKDFELKVFEGCMPFEIMAKRGEQTLLYGPMKPVGLEQPDGTRPYAVVQLRQDNAIKTLYNIVGFQTHLTFGEQERIIHMIPGLEHANIIRYGVMHKNNFINSPKVLNQYLQLKTHPHIFFGGQVTGVDGYIESASTGINAAINMDRYLRGEEMVIFPQETAIGALSYYITHADPNDFQPMKINFGIIKDFDLKVKKKYKKMGYAIRAIYCFNQFVKDNGVIN